MPARQTIVTAYQDLSGFSSFAGGTPGLQDQILLVFNDSDDKDARRDAFQRLKLKLEEEDWI